MSPPIPFSKLPLISSDKLVKALLRLDYLDGARHGSHVTYLRERENGCIASAVVIIGRHEIPKGTLRKILASLEIDEDEFRDAQ